MGEKIFFNEILYTRNRRNNLKPWSKVWIYGILVIVWEKLETDEIWF